MYKIIHNDMIIDVVENPSFIKFLASGHIAFVDKSSAEGIVGSDSVTVYCFTPIKGQNYKKVTIDKISIEEFKRLSSLLNSGQAVSADESALAKAKQSKIRSLSNICKNKIISGFSLELSNRQIENFKLTVEDQLNLMLIENQLAANEQSFIYHATNKPCQVYLREDMIKIVNTFRSHVLYHTTYFNTVKQYINSLTDIETVNLFTYGTDVSDFVENKVLKQILKKGETNANES